MNFQERLRDLEELFGRRNAMYLRGDMPQMFLTAGVSHLGKLLRKKEPNKHVIGHALASIFARTAAYAESFKDLPIIEALCEKYPPGKCAYCLKFPCGCTPENRPTITHATISESQLIWTVKEWCRHLHSVYGESNTKQGVTAVHLRLTEEVGEITSEYMTESQNQSLNLNQVRQNLAREFADAFAWVFSISAMQEIDLDLYLDERYSGVHHRCHERPCSCGPHYWYTKDPRIPATKAESVVET